MKYFVLVICTFSCMLISKAIAINSDIKSRNEQNVVLNSHSHKGKKHENNIFLESQSTLKNFQRMRTSNKLKKGSIVEHFKNKAIDGAIGVAKKHVPAFLLPKRPDRKPMPKIPGNAPRIPLPKIPTIESIPQRKIGESVAQIEGCVGCVFVWEKANGELDQSAGYEAVKDAFERTCAAMTPVFYDACDSMFENEDQMIQDYLNNKPYTKMCQNIGICSKKLPGGIPGAKKAKRL